MSGYDALIQFARDVEHAVFTGKATPVELPWSPIPGKRCPFCWGQGFDDGGPGSWSCDECDRTGKLPLDWRSEAHMNRRPPPKFPLATEWIISPETDLIREYRYRP